MAIGLLRVLGIQKASCVGYREDSNDSGQSRRHFAGGAAEAGVFRSGSHAHSVAIWERRLEGQIFLMVLVLQGALHRACA